MDIGLIVSLMLFEYFGLVFLFDSVFPSYIDVPLKLFYITYSIVSLTVVLISLMKMQRN